MLRDLCWSAFVSGITSKIPAAMFAHDILIVLRVLPAECRLKCSIYQDQATDRRRHGEAHIGQVRCSISHMCTHGVKTCMADSAPRRLACFFVYASV